MRYVALSLIFIMLIGVGTMSNGFYPRMEDTADQATLEGEAPMHPVILSHSTTPSIVFLGRINFRRF